jgi:uncharacterized protein YdeI (YjbR/CyaY-like superfamily)
MDPRVSCADRQAWRTWMENNHDTCPEVWLVLYRKHAATPCVAYANSTRAG